ncbi:NAD(P)/FAD-dependent oxidoreductase, partial [Fulvivirga sp. RKSG066]|uniref:NAD(P)/FAD-dependent oxidoreductase n=1 Tax=Fulvivirga aurantia TaxID=2529383 RepID=UPI0012BC7884
VGGGLAGLISSILLSRSGYDVVLIEKKKYPFHKVCGEYISNEVKGFLKQHDLFPHHLEPSSINRFRLSSITGKAACIDLNLGGFGISRYTLDHFLVSEAKEAGVIVMEETTVDNIKYERSHNDHFNIILSSGKELLAKFVIGAYGKRSKIDKQLNRSFIQKRSPYIGVKYHIRFDHPDNEVALHNFKGGYCGLNKVDGGLSNLCYLSTRENLRRHGQIRAMEEAVLCQNPELKAIFSNAKFVFDQPEVINEISFETKGPVDHHILMCGDAAGMITPLCGNGMAMAIHSAKVVYETLHEGFKYNLNRAEIEILYSKRWRSLFASRLSIGRQLQKLFGSGALSNFSVGIINNIKPLARFLVEKTHGKPF